MRRLVAKWQRYDRYHSLNNDLIRLQNNIKSLNQDLDQEITRLNDLRNQATTSSNNNSANSNND